MRATILLLLLLAPAARASTLERVTATLRTLDGTTPLRAALDLHIVVEEDDDPPLDARTAISISADGDGLSVIVPSSELRRAEAEKRETDPEKPRPAMRSLGSIDAVAIASAIHYAPQLLASLEGARVIKESSTTIRGEPAQLLELELKVRMSKDDAKHVKQAKRTSKLWVAADGTPLAEEVRDQFKARILIVGFELQQTESRQFARVGDRLVVTRADEKSSGAGLGSKTKQRTVTTLRVNGAP